jgi:UPF0716 protein FxsA
VFLILLLLLVVPVLEIMVFVQVAGAIGVLDALGVLVLFSVGGLFLVRHEGMGTMARMRAELDAGRVPTGQLADGFWLFLAGVLLIIPGFVTDFAGLLLLLPPVRGLAKRWFGRRFGRGDGVSVIRVEGIRTDGWTNGPANGPAGPSGRGDWIDAAGEEHRDDPPGRGNAGDPPELLP